MYKADQRHESELQKVELITDDYEKLLENVDAVYIRSLPKDHYEHIKKALMRGKHVLCESPLTLSQKESRELFQIAEENGLILMEAIKTAYATAFSRLLLLIKGGNIGDVISVDSTCTSLRKQDGMERTDWDGIYEWGPTALLPILNCWEQTIRIIRSSHDFMMQRIHMTVLQKWTLSMTMQLPRSELEMV